MRVLSEAVAWGSPPEPVCLAVGVFDGVHRGHAEVVRSAVEAARRNAGRAIAVTFDRHPQSVVAPESAPPLVYPLWRRLEALAALGLDGTLVFSFTPAFAAQSGEVFVERLALGFGRLAAICVGTNFAFGHRRSGDLALLQAMGRRHGFAVAGIAPLGEGGDIVSSTRVREAVAAGDLDSASRWLGRPYGIAGEVMTGDRIGRQLGFPTANLDVRGLVLPPGGVYAAWARGPGGEPRAAAVNIGRRPTVDGRPGPVRVEAHVLDFAGDLYGARLEVEVAWRLRDEMRFASLDDLKARIAADVAEVRRWSETAGNRRLPCPGSHL